MAAIEALATNWRPARTNPGYAVEVPANYGTAGRLSFWHWLRNTQIPNTPPNAPPLYNALVPVDYRLGVTVVPVTITVPVQTTPQMAFTPAGTAQSLPGAAPINRIAQVWTGAV